MSNICVLHLVWDRLGIAPFRRFLESYGIHRSGLKHDLLIIFQGSFRRSGLSEYHKLLDGYGYKSMFRHNVGYDIRAYWSAAGKFNYEYFCFLNSHSIILDDDWLEKMYSHIIVKNVGLVGPTGSWESPYSISLMGPSEKKRPFYRAILSPYWWRIWQEIYKYYYDPFPNYHIRTSAFMISRELINRIRCNFFYNKASTVRFECGKSGLSKQIMKMNLRLLVVGKDGIGYEKEEWYNSNTFRKGNQENLLILDKHTNDYLTSDIERRKLLSRLAWGDEKDN
jgi:hypothetical protein